jgi:hypothetical protein
MRFIRFDHADEQVHQKRSLLRIEWTQHSILRGKHSRPKPTPQRSSTCSEMQKTRATILRVHEAHYQTGCLQLLQHLASAGAIDAEERGEAALVNSRKVVDTGKSGVLDVD